MFGSRRLVALLAAILVVVLLLAVGCNKKVTGGGGTEAQNLTITLRNYTHGGSFPNRFWIVVGNADGNAVIATQRVTQDGQVNFGDMGTSHVSVSLVSNYSQGYSFVESYLNAPVGDWVLAADSAHSDTLGHAQIDATFPPGQFHHLHLYWPLGGLSYTLADSDTSFQYTVGVLALEDNRFTVLATLDSIGNVPLRHAWLPAQALQLGQTNHYVLNLVETPISSTVTTSRAINSLSVYGLRGTNYDSYYFAHAVPTTDSTIFHFDYPAMPVNRYHVYGGVSDLYNSYSVDYSLNSLPTSLTVPMASATANYDAAMRRYNNITVTGASDALEGMWYTGNNLWRVYSPVATEIRMPVIPDSILVGAHIDSLTFIPQGVVLIDYDACSGFDDFVNLEFHSDSPWLSRFHTYYTYDVYGFLQEPADGLNDHRIQAGRHGHPALD